MQSREIGKSSVGFFSGVFFSCYNFNNALGSATSWLAIGLGTELACDTKRWAGLSVSAMMWLMFGISSIGTVCFAFTADVLVPQEVP